MARRRRRVALALAVTIAVAVMAAGCGASPPQSRSNKGLYVALGDSYTAFPGPRTLIDARCGRSGANYPHLLAAALGYRLTDVSCGGATTSDLIKSQKSSVPPQLDAVTASTSLVTIGLGVNDSGISVVMFKYCSSVRDSEPGGAPCRDKTAAWASWVIKRLRLSLIGSFGAIRSLAPQARVIAVGYPQILGTSGACAKFPLATADIKYVNWFNSTINATIQAAAAKAGVEYLNVDEASQSHGICSTSPWVNGVTTIPGVAAAFHPFPAEQKAVAELLESRLKSPAS